MKAHLDEGVVDQRNFTWVQVSILGRRLRCIALDANLEKKDREQ